MTVIIGLAISQTSHINGILIFSTHALLTDWIWPAIEEFLEANVCQRILICSWVFEFLRIWILIFLDVFLWIFSIAFVIYFLILFDVLNFHKFFEIFLRIFLNFAFNFVIFFEFFLNFLFRDFFRFFWFFFFLIILAVKFHHNYVWHFPHPT